MAAVAFGVHLISRGDSDPTTTPFPSHRVMAEDGVRVEQLGFESVWLPDHFYYQEAWGLETHPEVWTLLTAIAVKTERVRLGTNVLAATFRHPALMAKMAGAVQELSGGRFVLGLGAGNQTHEHAAFGLDFDHRFGRMKEYLPIVSALLNGESVTFEGRYFQLHEASLGTVILHVPVWVPRPTAGTWPAAVRIQALFENSTTASPRCAGPSVGISRTSTSARCHTWVLRRTRRAPGQCSMN